MKSKFEPTANLNRSRSILTNQLTRSVDLIEQTVNLRHKIMDQDGFLTDESDPEDGSLPVPEPVYIRSKKLSGADLVNRSMKEYPKPGVNLPKVSGQPLSLKKFIVQKKIIRAAKNDDGPDYLKSQIRKNGVIFKRPQVRPKHLVDCLIGILILFQTCIRLNVNYII